MTGDGQFAETARWAPVLIDLVKRGNIAAAKSRKAKPAKVSAIVSDNRLFVIIDQPYAKELIV